MLSGKLARSLTDTYQALCDQLIAECQDCGHWTGNLSTSALSTATAVVALELLRRGGGTAAQETAELRGLIDGGLQWLAGHQNADGGWGDTTRSFSNISTTMLAHAAFHASGRSADFAEVVGSAAAYIEHVGGVAAVLRRYGKDRTFSIPILTHCALAGLVDWSDVLPLPFELACVPHRFYRTVRLPVVSYALPALIAIGQVRHHHRRSRNPLVNVIRDRVREPSLRVLERIQPSNGGFLEATPLTSFVTMSLAGMGLQSHPVARRGLEFLKASVHPDGSWPIDTNLSTWVSTLAINALNQDLPVPLRSPLREWLIGQQYTEVHPYTQAAPGGWAWTDLPGGVPDADDTPGAILALLQLSPETLDAPSHAACQNAVHWLLDLQNRDGGWPTFCRGWGALPFDRSAPDLTAHVLRALHAWQRRSVADSQPDVAADSKRSRRQANRIRRALTGGFRYLARTQGGDGSWLPLWFGNQHHPQELNPTYGTARVLMGYRDCGRLSGPAADRGLDWLAANQNADGGWGGRRTLPSSLEETALAVEALLTAPAFRDEVERGLQWLIDRIETHRAADEPLEPSPIGFYFAKLWYFERLYPLTFVVSAMGKALQLVDSAPSDCRQTHHVASAPP